MNACLPCNINPDCICFKCRKAFCDQHTLFYKETYDPKEYKYIKLYVCKPCHKKWGINRVKATRPKLSLRELHKLVREIHPKEYVSVSIEISDHDPCRKPSLEYTIYSSVHGIGHHRSKDPVAALRSLCKALKVKCPYKGKKDDLVG